MALPAAIRFLNWLVLLFVVFSATCSTAKGDIGPYIRKYDDATVPAALLERLEIYDHLIDYFTGFSYFRPRYRVSGDFIRALILAESGADANAVSTDNAFGLGQILLSTGQLAARELAGTTTDFRYIDKQQLANLGREDLFDPATNILLTCYLIAKYNHRFNGRLDLVVSAWNAGENTESLTEGRHAPYEETKELIGRVNGYYLFFLRRRGLID